MVGKTVQMNVNDAQAAANPDPAQAAEAAAPAPPAENPPPAAGTAPPSAEAAPAEEAPRAAGDAEPLSPAGHLLSELVDESIKRGLHTAESFIDRFPPDAIMGELADEPKLRAKILTATLHLPEHTAELLTPPVAGSALATALSASDTNATQILEHFAPDDRVRQLPWAALWAFVTEGSWWKKGDDLTKGFTLFVLERAQEHGLMDPNVWRDGLTIGKLATALPRELVEKLFERSASLGASNKAFTGAEIFNIVKATDLVAVFEPDYLFDRVILPLARRAHFLVEGGSVPPMRSTQTDLQSPTAESPGPAKAQGDAPEDAGWGDEAAVAGKGGKKKGKAKNAG